MTPFAHPAELLLEEPVATRVQILLHTSSAGLAYPFQTHLPQEQGMVSVRDFFDICLRQTGHGLCHITSSTHVVQEHVSDHRGGPRFVENIGDGLTALCAM